MVSLTRIKIMNKKPTIITIFSQLYVLQEKSPFTTINKFMTDKPFLIETENNTLHLVSLLNVLQLSYRYMKKGFVLYSSIIKHGNESADIILEYVTILHYN